MLGSLVQGDKEESHDLWSTYQSDIYNVKDPDLLFRLLIADSDIAH